MEGKERIHLLAESLNHLRRDAVHILSEINLPADLEEVEQILEEEKWLASSNEYPILDLIRSLAVIATALRQDTFAITRDRLIRLLMDELGEDEWEVEQETEEVA
ncbi:MAG: hypothetical protein ACFFD6_07095 [Candidatus Thorarchaeota archaeon]